MGVNHFFARLFVEELVRCGVENFCIAPGGQSTALVVAASENPRVKTHVHYDERGASYFALGQARASGKPSVIICTSGTAAANIYPAVIEASISREPLIVVSADLPWEQTDSGVNQAIDHTRIFSDYLRWRFDFPAPEASFDQRAVLSTIDQAVARSHGISGGATAGPVHLNCRFRAPLVEPDNKQNYQIANKLSDWISSTSPMISYSSTSLQIANEELREIAASIKNAERGVIVVGQLPSYAPKDAILEFGAQLGWPVICDVLSGLRFGVQNVGTALVSQITLYAPNRDFREKLAPDVVLHLGGDIVLRPPEGPYLRGVHAFLNAASSEYIVVNDTPTRQDPFATVTKRCVVAPNEFCKSLLEIGVSQNRSTLLEVLQSAEENARGAVTSRYSGEQDLSELSSVFCALENLPPYSSLFIGNSMPIREIDCLSIPSSKEVLVSSNHGVKGIDGTIASAAGFAKSSGRPTVLVIGDVSFLHDLNSLALCNSLQVPLVMVLLNNDGGNIFSFVASGKTKQFKEFFLAPHGFSFEATAEQFGIPYSHPESLDEFTGNYGEALELKGPSLIEVKTSREQFIEEQESLFAEVQNSVLASLD